MTDADTWTALIGVVLPPVIALINQRHWPPAVKGIVALVVCWLVSLLVVVVHGAVDWRDWRHVAFVVTGAALVSYHVFWKPSTIAPAIEAGTTPPRVPPQQ